MKKVCSNLMLILFLPLLAAGGAGLNLVKCLSARGHGDQGIYKELLVSVMLARRSYI